MTLKKIIKILLFVAVLEYLTASLIVGYFGAPFGWGYQIRVNAAFAYVISSFLVIFAIGFLED